MDDCLSHGDSRYVQMSGVWVYKMGRSVIDGKETDTLRHDTAGIAGKPVMGSVQSCRSFN